VVVAMANYQQPVVPGFARELDPRIVQLHSLAYRSPAQLAAGDVLLVGAGNSGADIALELVAGRTTWLSGRDTGHILFHRVLTVDTPIGRKVRPKVLRSGGPLIRVKPRDLLAAGVRRVPRTVGARDGRPLLDDGRVLDVANVIWCTGFKPGFSWIDLPVLDERGEPRHERGLVSDVPGLYFVGLHFLYALSSTMIHGVARDAGRVATAIAVRVRETMAA
jgi:putative flavoprotein involved in K+ transport